VVLCQSSWECHHPNPKRGHVQVAKLLLLPRVEAAGDRVHEGLFFQVRQGADICQLEVPQPQVFVNAEPLEILFTGGISQVGQDSLPG